MKILFLLTDAFGGNGGIAKFNRDLLKALCSHPNCTKIIAVPRLIQRSIEESLPSKLIYVNEGVNSKLKYAATVLKIFFTYRPFDLIICGHINLLPIAYILNLFERKTPIFMVLHGAEAWQPTQNWLTNYLAKKIKTFISVSEITKMRFLKWVKLEDNVVFVLPNSIDVSSYGSGPRNSELLRRYSLNDKTVLLTMGRLARSERLKGFDEVLELLPDLKREIPNLVYLVAGEGTDRKRLEKKVKSLGVTGYVIFTGFVPESQKADYYRLADCFVMPGRGEGFGIVYLEAMACGVPVVASKADGSREAVRNGELGILVDPSNPEDIKQGILEALKRPKGVIPEGLDYFSYENYEKRVHAIIDQVVPKMEAVT